MRGQQRADVRPPCSTPARQHRSKDTESLGATAFALSGGSLSYRPKRSSPGPESTSDCGSLTLPWKLPQVGSSSSLMGSSPWRVFLQSPQAPAFLAKAKLGKTPTPGLGSCQRSGEAPLPPPSPGRLQERPWPPVCGHMPAVHKGPLCYHPALCQPGSGEGVLNARALGPSPHSRGLSRAPGLTPDSGSSPASWI